MSDEETREGWAARPELPFENQEADFALGFECGRMWAILREQPDQATEFLVHAENSEMVLRMAEATSRPVQSFYDDGHWTRVVFGAEDTTDIPEAERDRR